MLLVTTVQRSSHAFEMERIALFSNIDNLLNSTHEHCLRLMPQVEHIFLKILSIMLCMFTCVLCTPVSLV